MPDLQTWLFLQDWQTLPPLPQAFVLEPERHLPWSQQPLVQLEGPHWVGSLQTPLWHW